MAATEEASRLEREDSPPSFATSDIVRVIVGKKRTVFKLHRDVLMEKSPFFRKCLTSGMIEQQTNEVSLPEDSSRAFEFIVRWMYSTSILGARKDWEECEIYLIMGAWVLADKYCMPDLQNALIDELGFYWSKEYMNPDHLSWVADHANNESPLYRMALDQMAHDLKDGFGRYGLSAIQNEEQNEERYSKGLKKALARPDLSYRLLSATVFQFDENDPPAESSQKYHVPTDLQIARTTTTDAAKRKREADDNTKEPEVASKVTRQS
ncbi:hypothetical protein LTR96_004166 [Exophiala xenobiotica]|nr:hypothetical protein H2202_005394 [Exophiala xenobiotica]KAK5227199.1 hypothetical protein LTR72_003189 [Exophiala xenobiotica]KAK5270888.1 hypothetical protein LTR96_004166 [Exophiala xenobiotica]KAK5300948.1 hypothetical protein LTR14_001346 [Exophiala xenobiotica]KAK5339778.1 hypothetical protein LTR98_004580 [Exophiala xenobiotica]